MVLLIDQAQPFHREVGIDVLDSVRYGPNQGGMPSRGNDDCLLAKLSDHSFQNSVNEANISVIQA